MSDKNEPSRKQSTESNAAHTIVIQRRISVMMTIVVSILSVFAGIQYYWVLPGSFSNRTSSFEKQLYFSIEELKGETSSLREDIGEISIVVESISQPDLETEVGTQLAMIREQINILNEKISLIDTALVENPTKALSIPLLRHDFEHVKESYEKERINYTKEIDRIYDLNKWFLGLMITILLGVITVVYNQYSSKSSQAESNE